MKKQLTIITLLSIVPIGFGLDYLAHAELTLAARLIIAGVTFTAIASLIFYLVAYGLILLEKVRMVQAKRQQAQRDANLFYLVAEERQQVYIREDDNRAVWRPLHLNAGHYQNGKQAEPTPAEVALYQIFHSRPQAAQPVPLLGEGQSIPELLPILDSAQRVLIIGATDAGKTNLLQWVVSRRTGAVIVIDPHSSPGKWGDKVTVVGAGSNHPEIETTLDNLIELMVKRYREISAGLVREGEHPKLTVVVDEWMSIAYQCHNATEVMVRLLTESRKAAMSVIIGSHSERVKSLGLDGRGDLKDGFLFIRLTLESTGERKATFDYGRGARPCVLPGKFSSVIDVPVIEIEAITEVRPTAEEQRILELKAEGLSNRDISQAVWGDGKFGQFYNGKIDNVLAKFGEK